MDLDKLRIFYYAAQAKSFTNCELNLSPSAISRHISDLEYRLKAPLFHRQARGLVLTEQGEVLLHSVRKIFNELDTARTMLSELSHDPQGTFRLAVPTGWASVVLVRYLTDFLKLYPKIRLEMISCDQTPDFSLNDIDAAILPRQPDRPHLIQQYLASLTLKLYASPAYLAEYGTPQNERDLDQHRLISFGKHDHFLNELNWHLSIGAPKGDVREPFLITSASYHAAEEGLGITTLAAANPLLRSGNLVEVLPELTGPVIKGYYIYPEHLKESKRVRLFGDFLHACIHRDYSAETLIDPLQK